MEEVVIVSELLEKEELASHDAARDVWSVVPVLGWWW